MRVVAAFCWTCEKIESVQRRFTKRLCCINLAYRERLVNLELDRPELRRLRFDLIYIYTFIRHEDRIGLQQGLKNKQTDRQTNKHYNYYLNCTVIHTI